MKINKKTKYTIQLNQDELNNLTHGLVEYEDSTRFTKETQTSEHIKAIIDMINTLDRHTSLET